MNDIIEIIPANPPIGGHNSKRYREIVAENTDLSVRGRAGSFAVIPPPPVDERVEVPPPAQRRNFGPPPMAHTTTTRRKD